jgi:hypothetical protein
MTSIFLGGVVNGHAGRQPRRVAVGRGTDREAIQVAG